MTEKEIRDIVSRIVEGELGRQTKAPPAFEVPAEASARHVHLSKDACEALFGAGALTEAKALSQPGEFVSKERVRLVTAKNTIAGVAVLGPLREKTQVELSLTDAVSLGVTAPINLSGNLTGAADMLLVGPAGSYLARQSVIVARAHIHMRPEDARRALVSHGDRVNVRVTGCRSAVIEDVVIRVNERYRPALHLDFDEANACGLNKDSKACIIARGAADRVSEDAVGATEDTPPTVAERMETRSKRLVITEKQAKELVDRNDKLHFPPGTIFTPSAKDVLRQAGHSI